MDVGGDTDVTIVHYTWDVERVCLCEWLWMSVCACFRLCVCVCVVVCAFLVVCMTSILAPCSMFVFFMDKMYFISESTVSSFVVYRWMVKDLQRLWMSHCVLCGVPCVLCGGCVCLLVLDLGAQITIVGPHLVVDIFL